MSEKYYSEPTESAALRSWVTWQMLRGAGYAAGFVVVIWLGYAVLVGLGALLPPESKEAPSPYGALEIIQPMAVV